MDYSTDTTLIMRIKIYIRLATYKGSHIDIDTSHDKVVGLPHQAVIICLP